MSTDWRARVLRQEDDIVVVDKPGGVPVMAHESNSRQTVPVSPAPPAYLLPPAYLPPPWTVISPPPPIC